MFDNALDELKMLHDAKNHDYATAENPYKNLEGVERIGIEAWRGIVIRLMDKFERVQQYCVNGELAIKSEGMEDTFKDIAVYSTLAMILFRKDQERTMAERFNLEPVDNLDARLISMRESAEKIIAKRVKDEEYENMHPMQAMRQIAEGATRGRRAKEKSNGCVGTRRN